ncbi:MAG: hypothetical protein IH841_08920 [Thaumarchaeota archaeon]|nr:hypothetical protein [Nitrososphaerota archaeon]
MLWYGWLAFMVLFGGLAGLIVNGMDFDFIVESKTSSNAETTLKQLEKLVEQVKDPSRDAETYAELEEVIIEYLSSPENVRVCQSIIDDIKKIQNDVSANPSLINDVELTKKAGQLMYDLTNTYGCNDPRIEDKLNWP